MTLYRKPTRILTLLALSMIQLSGCGKTIKPAQVKEAPDNQNLRSLFAVERALSYDEILKNKSIKLDKTPWTDTYWPLTNKELAARWKTLNAATEVGFADYLETFVQEAKKSEPSPFLSPAEKYDIVYQNVNNVTLDDASFADAISEAKAVETKIRDAADVDEKRNHLGSLTDIIASEKVNAAMNMTASGWSNFLYYSSVKEYQFLGNSTVGGESWSWMGICHGWAAAAVIEDAPKHSVQAEVAGKKILFTEGDIRGLLSKSWAQESPYDKQYFLGRRCNKDVANTSAPIPANSNGRGYTGNVKIAGETVNFIILDSLRDFPSRVFGSSASIYRVHLEEQNRDAYLVEARRNSAFLIDSFEQLVEVVSSGSASSLPMVSTEFYGCWDVNPASFHEILVEQLAVRKVGFVMDRTRNGQVWNQPVFAANFDVGSLVKVGAVKDVASAYRASGTAYLAEVEVSVSWVGEPRSQSMVYDENYEENYVNKTRYQYTLEFDADKNLIGGEWGTFAEMSPRAQAPDFLYGFEKGSKPVDTQSRSSISDAIIDYSGIISKIHQCSLSADTDGEQMVNGSNIKFKKCQL